MTLLLISTMSFVVVLILLSGFVRERTCPQCSEPLPHRRKSTSVRQMLWGGWTCQTCGSELDRYGRKMER